MRKYIIAILLFGMTITVQAQRTHILNPKIDSLFPEQPRGFVTDIANVIKNVDTLNRTMATLVDSQHLHIAAVTLSTIKDYQPYEVAMEIGRKWLVAQSNDTLTAATRHTGAVILLVMDKHQCYVATATGTEGYLTDNTAANICRHQRDNFRAGNFDAGLLGMVNEIGTLDKSNQTALSSPQTDTSSGGRGVFWVLVAFFSMAGLAIVGMLFQAIQDRKEETRRLEEWRKRQIERELEQKFAMEQERIRREEAKKRDDEYLNSLSPSERKIVLAERKKKAAEAEARRVEQERLAAIRYEADRKRRQEQEEEDRKRSGSSYSSSSDSSWSSSSDSSSSSWSSGGSDSFSGGGGGDSW